MTQDATSDLPLDKAVTYEDAYKVLQAELRGSSVDELKEGGVAATLVAAADLNEAAGFIQATGAIAGEESMDEQAIDTENDISANELMNCQPLKPTPSADFNKPAAGTEETTPLVKKDDEQPAAQESQETRATKEPEAIIT
jgi:hypothetical protein